MRTLFRRNLIRLVFILIVCILFTGWLFNAGTVRGFFSAQSASEADQWEEAEAARLREQLKSNSLDARTRKSLEEKLSIAELSIEERELVGDTIYAQGMVVPTPPAGRADRAFETGIIEDGEDILPPTEAVLSNRWQGVVGQEYWQVFAGTSGNDSTQGIVVRVITSPDRLNSQLTIIKALPGDGALRVTSGDQTQLQLEAANGKQYRLNPDTMELMTITE